MKTRVQDLMITISAFALLILLVVSAAAIVGKLVNGKNDSFLLAAEEYMYTDVVVQSGDTLWSIARAQVPDEDPRDVVGAMRDLNELESADIFPGQVLTVLVKESLQPRQFAESLGID